MLTFSNHLARKQAVAASDRCTQEASRSPAPSPAPSPGGAVSGSAEDTAAAIIVEYCVPGNYEPVASALADAIYRELGEFVSLRPSRDGVFEVRVRGRLVFSKRASWRFPDHDEIFYHVKSR